MPQQEFSLYDLNRLLRRAVQASFPDRYWVRAELSEVRENASSGHCYLEFVEKSPSGQIVARAKGMIWASVYRMLKLYFERETGQRFTSGIKVLTEVSPDFHELYGYSLTVHDIDPSYTLGDMARHRAEILRRLQEDGVADMNKELEWPLLPRRIAVISSATAAGYGDFMNQLHRNRNGYRFYTSIFTAVMQGEQVEDSVIAALERIYDHTECFDGVVIIRGGGATSDLNCFDSYRLALHIAQFPLPVITGIGHDRDDTVIDAVANVRVKTPTAAAEWLIDRMERADGLFRQLRDSVVSSVKQRLESERQAVRDIVHGYKFLAGQVRQNEQIRLYRMRQTLRMCAVDYVEAARYRVRSLSKELPSLLKWVLAEKKPPLTRLSDTLNVQLSRRIGAELERLTLMERTIELVSPERLLEKGYTLTLKAGKSSDRPLKSNRATFCAPGWPMEK